MDRTGPADRRAAGARPRTRRRLAAALRAGLYRQLAQDDDRAAYWVRHARIGVLLTEIACAAALGYLLLTDTPAHGSVVTYCLLAVAAFGTPALLLLPLAAWMRDARGSLLFYAWSLAVTAIVVVVSRIDGGSASPLYSLLFLTLAFMALAYPPAGVVAMGTVMTGAYVLLVAPPHVTLSVLFIAVVMGAFTTVCAMASANSWAAHEQQVRLTRAQEALASTDPLTGVCNRRAFLRRLEAALDESAATVVCLVDLDGFKGVNDHRGHGAGDAVLQEVARALAAAVRETDTVARLGGDEFAVLAEVTAVLPADDLAERLRAAVARVGRPVGVTASVGVAEVRPEDDVLDLLHRADAAMYRAKTAGGDRVTVPLA
ncbi:diguanylate cyclase domain-containing protein [Geodermatophilus sp. SYSU D00815]